MNRRISLEFWRTLLLALPLLSILSLGSCLTSVDEIVTDHDTLSAPLGDIVSLGDYLFSTNEDHYHTLSPAR